MYYKPQTKQTA